MTIHVTQNVLSNSGEMRLRKYLKNAGSMGWILVWWGYMTQQLLSVQKHLSFTLEWLCWLQVHVFTWWTITPVLGITAFVFTVTTTIALRIQVYNNVIYDICNNHLFPNILSGYFQHVSSILVSRPLLQVISIHL